MERAAKRGIAIPMIQGVVITYAFLLVEFVLNELGMFEGPLRLYLTDSPLRFLFGGIALFLISANYKKQRSLYSLKEMFTNKFSWKAYIYMLPFIVCLALILLTIMFSYTYSLRAAGQFALCSLQQLGTGFYEEAVRVLILCGFMKFFCNTKSQRVKTVLISGALFGLSHGLNFLYGQDILSTLEQVAGCFTWGMLMAALFLYTKNLTLLMVIHAVWDIIVRLPKAFFGFPEVSTGMMVLDVAGDVIQYVVMPVIAVIICLRLDKD
jgi:hypothetical protein